ncbi:hypothetical protein CDAR_199671 [Caerostris darwini]|uniref:Uncharacterized protein n=1 Tax=Caerostris darwini TaxID=1538125 RepID=A0AAV4V5Z5_9ARAC|nr:hypothetical protein CDAR_199671 [Caerostris darwini]
MSNRFRVAFREKLCAENPCTCASCFFCCCWKTWRDYYQAQRNRGSSSASSSHRVPHANITSPPADPVVQPRLQPSLREKTPTSADLGRYFGKSHSDETRKSIEEDRPHFNSDPNFSLMLAVNRCKDLSSADDSDYHLARDKHSNEYGNGECISCVSCNSVFATKQRMGLYSSIPQCKRPSISEELRRVATQEESRL